MPMAAQKRTLLKKYLDAEQAVKPVPERPREQEPVVILNTERKKEIKKNPVKQAPQEKEPKIMFSFWINESLSEDLNLLAKLTSKSLTAYLNQLIAQEVNENSGVIARFRQLKREV